MAVFNAHSTEAGAFDYYPGEAQGRVVPSRWAPTDGTHAMVLGADRTAVTARLLSGDNTQVSQAGAVDGSAYFRFRAYVIGPTTMPVGASWRFEWLVDNVVSASHLVRPGEAQRLDAGALLTQGLSGDHTLAFRLRLAGATGAVYEVELPGVYVDTVASVDGAIPAIYLLNPTPLDGATDVGLATTLRFTLLSTVVVGSAVANVDLSATTVTVGGEVAYAEGAFVAPYAGGSSLTTPSTGATVFALVRAGGLPSSTPITISVTTAVGGVTTTASYAFTTLDTTPPTLISAAASALRTVRVVFSEAMLGATDPGSYVFGPVSAPSFVPDVTGVTRIAPNIYDLALSTDLSPQATYTLSVVGPTDLKANLLAPPTNVVTMTAPDVARPANRSFDLFGMLPLINQREDARGTGDLRLFMRCLQEIVDLQLADIDAFSDTLDPDLAPEANVDLMLADLGNPFDFDLSLADKRRLLQVLVSLYKQKGTGPGIANVARFFLGLDVTVIAYSSSTMSLGDSELGVDWELGGSASFDRYAFAVLVPVALEAETRTRLSTLVTYMKPAHTHFVAIVEPEVPEIVDDVELGLSELGVSFTLH